MALRSWADGLGLPRGTLFGADVDGEPTVPDRPSFIKYHSAQADAAVACLPGPESDVALPRYVSIFDGETEYQLDSVTSPPDGCWVCPDLLACVEHATALPSSDGSPYVIVSESKPSVADDHMNCVFIGIQSP